MRRSLAVAMLAVVALAGACSTKPYSSAEAVSDLETQAHLTHRQALCVINGIRKHYAAQIVAKQKSLKGSPLPSDRLKLEVDDALASIDKPRAVDVTAARAAIVKCAPDALR